MQSILAGATSDYRWDRDRDNGATTDKSGNVTPRPKGGYRLATEVSEGPVFTVGTLDFWEAQGLLDSTVPAVDRIRKGLELGLVSIDGDADKAKRFLAKPKARLVNPLFDLILEIAAGN